MGFSGIRGKEKPKTLAEQVITKVELSAESVRYYASLVEFYTVYKLKRMDREAVRPYLLLRSALMAEIWPDLFW